MGSEWPTVRLGDHVDACLGKMLDKNKNQGTYHPYLGNKQVRWGSFDLDDLAEMRFEDHEHERYGLRFGDLVVCEGGEPGRCALWKDEVPNMKIQKALHRIRPKPELDSTYLHYWFCYAGKFELLEPYFTGTTIKHLTGKAIAELPVPLPPLPEQKAIVHILGTLDDKIELNRRMNATLEGMAQALFKSWFVDFDPVIDNALAAGNPIPDELAPRAELRKKVLEEKGAATITPHHSQFPATFTHTEELGWIPEGWEVTSLGSQLDVLETGRRPKGGVSKYSSGVPSVGAESINGIGGFVFEKTKYVPTEFFEKMKSGKVQSYDVLLYKDGGKPGDFKPRIGMYGENFPFTEFGINEHVFRLRSKSLDQPFLYFQTGSKRVFHHLAIRGGKAAIPGINQTELKSVDFLIPNREALSSFNDITYPKLKRILTRASDSLTLTKLRDTLLPKLISGELRIPEAAKLTKDALA